MLLLNQLEALQSQEALKFFSVDQYEIPFQGLDRSVASWSAAQSGVLKYQRRMYHPHRRKIELPLVEIATVQFQANQRSEPPLDLIEIPLVISLRQSS